MSVPNKAIQTAPSDGLFQSSGLFVEQGCLTCSKITLRNITNGLAQDTFILLYFLSLLCKTTNTVVASSKLMFRTLHCHSFSDSTSPSRKIVLICLPRFILPCTEHIVLLRGVENKPGPPVPPLPPAQFLIGKADSVSRSLTVRGTCIPLTTLPRNYTT